MLVRPNTIFWSNGPFLNSYYRPIFSFPPPTFLCTKISTLFGGKSIDLRDLEKKKKKSNHTEKDQWKHRRRFHTKSAELEPTPSVSGFMVSRATLSALILSNPPMKMYSLFLSLSLFSALLLSDSWCLCVF